MFERSDYEDAFDLSCSKTSLLQTSVRSDGDSMFENEDFLAYMASSQNNWRTPAIEIVYDEEAELEDDLMELFFPPTCPFFTIEDYKHAMTWLYLNRVDLGAEPVPIVNTLNLDYSSCSPATQTAT